MGPSTERILQAALALPEGDRLELVEAILASDDTPGNEPDLHPDWLDEIRRRLAQIDAGAVKLAPWPEVRTRVRQRLEARRSRG